MIEMNKQDNEQSYWTSNGKYQKKADMLNSMVPEMGESFDTRIETFRKASNIYYDIFNNGGDNIMDGMARNGEFKSMREFINNDIKKYLDDKQEKQDEGECYYSENDTLFKDACKACDKMMDAVIEWIESTGFFEEKKP